MGNIKSHKGKKQAKEARQQWVPEPMSIEELRKRPTVDLLEAAAALGIGRTTAYEMARRDEFPVRVLKIRSSWRVPTAGLVEFIEG